ncbi:hypothetical protein [Haloarchaeobius litoreus]|uniref:Uncharacterized protein n=1 Tax=Haloarchaeobius litoreus TaxID=755306 RepID=A0ABD6DMU0_9EURY|nr:hypothetical protein [Haloarchaeobius litoreus]
MSDDIKHIEEEFNSALHDVVEGFKRNYATGLKDGVFCSAVGFLIAIGIAETYHIAPTVMFLTGIGIATLLAGIEMREWNKEHDKMHDREPRTDE